LLAVSTLPKLTFLPIVGCSCFLNLTGVDNRLGLPNPPISVRVGFGSLRLNRLDDDLTLTELDRRLDVLGLVLGLVIGLVLGLVRLDVLGLVRFELACDI